MRLVYSQKRGKGQVTQLTHLRKVPRNRISRWSSPTSSDFDHEKPAYSIESRKNPISASYFRSVNVRNRPKHPNHGSAGLPVPARL
jgi:hypothetical protein